MTFATKTTPFQPLVRDVIFAEIALREEKISPDALQRGWAVVKELDQFGITRHLPSVLLERKLLDPKTEKEVVQYFGRLKVTCALCHKVVSLDGMDNDGRVRCRSCETLLGLELTGGIEDLPDKLLEGSRPKIESRLKSVALQSKDAVSETGSKKLGGGEKSTSKLLAGGEKNTAKVKIDTKLTRASEAKASKPGDKTNSRIVKGVESFAVPTMPDIGPVSARTRGEDRDQKEETPALKEPALPAPPISARAVIQRYEIDSIISQGPYGRLYRAAPKGSSKDGSDKNPRLTIKLFAPDRIQNIEMADQLRDSLQQWNKFNQELLTPIHSLEQEGTSYYLVRNLIGEPFIPLAELRLNEWKDRVELLKRIARTLAKVHKAGQIHGNLKPTNIFLSKDIKIDQLLLVDPALHLMLPKSDNMLRWKILADNPRYRSPEEIAGENLTAASEVYSLGWIFFAILAGTPPFAGLPAPEILRRHREGPCPELAGDQKEWARLFNSMTALHPKERPANAVQVLQLIEDLSAGKKISLPAITPRPSLQQMSDRISRSNQRHLPLRYLLGPAALVLALGWIGWCFFKWEKASSMLASDDRHLALFNSLAADAYHQTQAEAIANPQEGRTLWKKYLQTFAGSPYDAAADAEMRNYPAVVPVQGSTR